jgi:hypothetical protein
MKDLSYYEQEVDTDRLILKNLNIDSYHIYNINRYTIKVKSIARRRKIFGVLKIS